MASSRGAANGALYRARILLAAWEDACAAGRFPEPYLTQAFLPAVREHLVQAYGWFLLAAAGIDDAAGGRPPRSTREVPAQEAGKAVPPELREFRLLEEEGWIAELLAEVPADAQTAVRPAQGLLGTDSAPPGPAVVTRWADRLAATMERMDDSLAEC